MINKNISIWRGSATPPTNYHLWEKEDGGLYVYLDEKWQHLVTPTDKTILDKHQQQLDKIKNLALTEIDPIDTNTYKSYQLKSDDNIFGTTINIPKDRFIKQVTLGYDNATIDESTGIITIGTGLSKEYLLFSVALESGSYELVSINLTNFLTEKDYSDGLEVIDNKLKVKVDPSSEEYLKVSNNGIKVEGIDTKVSDTVDDIKNKIQNGEWLSVRKGSGNDSVIVGGNNLATKQYSYAEGNNTTASGIYSHAEGYSNMALGIASHVEGMDNEASGQMSHAEGFGTKVSGPNSHAQGSYNYNDEAFIDMVGVGNANTRKNASIICYYAHEDPKNGYQYLLGIGGYKGQKIGDAKSVQEVITDLETNKVDKVEGKSLVLDTDITKLSELPNNATLNINIANAKKVGTDAQTSINTHINNTNNPHNVTKAQVGLDQVNNTSDVDKPISTATQNALDSKVDKVDGKQLSTNDYTTAEKNKVAESINESRASTLINTTIGNLTKASVGLNNVDNTADANKEVLSATKLKTARTLWGQSFDGTANVSGSLTAVTEVYLADGSKYAEPCTSDDIKALFA